MGKGKFVWPRKIPPGNPSHLEFSSQRSHVLQSQNHLGSFGLEESDGSRAACAVVIFPGEEQQVKDLKPGCLATEPRFFPGYRTASW